MTDAPGAWLFALAGVLAAVAWFVLMVARRVTLLAVLVGPIVAIWVIATEELPPTRYDQVAIFAMTFVGALFAVASLSYLRWLVRQLGDARNLCGAERYVRLASAAETPRPTNTLPDA